MAEQAKASGASDKLGDIAWLLFDQAKLLDGEAPSDPIAFSRRMEKVLEKAAA
jgi:molecular chaperone HtpG